MRDENNTPFETDSGIETETKPEQPFFDAIHETIDITRVQPGKLRKAATACLELAQAMVEKAETEMRAYFDKEARDFKARLDNAVDKGDKAIAESEELTRINVEANALLTEHANTIRSQAAEIEELKAQLEASNDLAVKAEVELRELLEKEQWARKKDVQTYVDAINNQGTIIGERDRTIASMQLAQNMAMQQVERLESKLTEAGHSRRALCETIETLANVIRNT